MERYVLDSTLDFEATQNPDVTDDVKVLKVQVEKAKPPTPTVDTDFLTVLTVISILLGLILV
ncbi:MAG: hypothetical protein QXO67_03910 [Candidatus Bathyarchaeia archaeon]